ncbi:hypothetical protein AJ80_01581 [Polytolypa hystricis UAMH7299]|uniref:2-hydroxyacyl-CoA lyase n=1 Tax=Polytolypa hystricis (strain UAMH7299) TaxID=1447883 RepID=A0A2B7YZP7_POLH7|nr:hypothetical protein AJ80_01581 [Polytolypa hystricis UAMH7299]
MSFLGGPECSTAGNPLTQFTKHVQDDKSLQRDRLVGRGPGGLQEGMRSRGMMGGQDQMMDEFLHQADQMPQGPTAAQPFAMEHMRRELANLQNAPQKPGSPGWAAEFDPVEQARMEAAFQGQKPGMAKGPGFSSAEFARFQQQRSGSPATAAATAAGPMMGAYQPQMGMGGMGMGYGGMGHMPMMQQPMGMHQQQQQQMQDVKGKGRMVELDDQNWEAQFAEMETAEQTGLDDQANAAMEAELNELDRSVAPDAEFGNFEDVWKGIQAEQAANRQMVDEDATFENMHMGDFGDWDNFDGGLNTHSLRDPQLGDYLFEEENAFRAMGNPFEEGMKVMNEGGNLSLAALAFEAAVQKDPQHVQAWTMLGSAQAQNEKESPAIRALEQALKLDASNLDALMGLAVSYTNEGYDSTAYRTLERWLSVKYPQVINPSDVSEEAELSFTDRHHLHEKVTDLFIRAAQLSPQGEHMDPDVQVGLGVLFYGAEEYDKAVDCFSAALASTESGTSNQQNQLHLLWNRLGATLANSGRSEEAIEAYEKALNINPNFVRARYNLGVSCINIGCYPEAAQHLLGALSMHKVVEQEGRERAREIVSGGSPSGDVDDAELDRMIHISQNQSTNLYDTLRRVFSQMGRRDLSDMVVNYSRVWQYLVHPLMLMLVLFWPSVTRSWRWQGNLTTMPPTASSAATITGSALIARTLRDLGVTVIFGIVGIPVVDIAEEAINLGIRFIAFRNEQACSYAASAYGYMTGRPGVCLVVGGPGVLHAVAGIGNASANAFPLLVLAGSAESNIITKGAFQEMDAISFLTPHTKLAVRPASPELTPAAIQNAYRTCWYGRPGPTFVDLPADLIQSSSTTGAVVKQLASPPERLHLVVAAPPPPKPSGDPAVIFKVAQLLRRAKAPLIVIGKGAAYARAESPLRKLVETTGIPFLPTPMGKGVIPDSHPLNSSSARSTALRHADVVLLLGARLNWILHYGEAPKWGGGGAPERVTFVQVDVHAEEIGRNAGNAEVGIVGDVGLVVVQLLGALESWKYQPRPLSLENNAEATYPTLLAASASKNERASEKKALLPTPAQGFLTFQRAFHIIKSTLNSLSPPDEGGVVYVSEGANTMDISRSIFALQHPRQRLDAGTYATMGVGLGYIVAAHAAYNLPSSPTTTITAAANGDDDDGLGPNKQKKIVALEGDSAFGFSAMEVETLARQRIPALIFVMNNSGIYHGDTETEEEWRVLQEQTTDNETKADNNDGDGEDGVKEKKKGLRSTSLLYETRYEQLATMCGGRGYFVRSEEELEQATREGFMEQERVTVVNVIVEPGIGGSIEFGWQASGKKEMKL